MLRFGRRWLSLALAVGLVVGLAPAASAVPADDVPAGLAEPAERAETVVEWVCDTLIAIASEKIQQVAQRLDRPIPDPCNTPPQADAGEDREALLGDAVALDGTGSSDADGDELTYAWTLSAPESSAADLDDATSATPTFVADRLGEYVAELVVDDGKGSSAPDRVTVIVDRAGDIALAPDQLDLQTFSEGALTVTLTAPAGPGGVVVNLTSETPSLAAVPATVTIAEGQDDAQVPVTTASESGVSAIHASADSYTEDTALVQVAARTMELRLDDRLVGVGRANDGSVVLGDPAPVGGVTVDLDSSDPAIATVDPASVFIAEGDTTAPFTVTGASEGSVVITASASGYADATADIGSTNALVSIGSVPTMSPGESRGLPISLTEPAPPGGVTVLLESSDPSIAGVEESVTIAAGEVLPAANPQVSGHEVGTAVISARTEGYAPDHRTVNVALALSLSPATLRVIEGRTGTMTVGLSGPAPAGGRTVNLSTADPAVATVPASVTVVEGQTSAQFTVTGGDVGSTSVRASAPGAAEVTATVHVDPTPDVFVGNAVVGRDLQQGLSVSLETAPPGPVDVTVSLVDASVALVSKDRSGAGSGSVTFTGVTSSFVGTIWVQGLAEGATTIVTEASGYDDDTSTVTVTPSGFYWGSGSFSSTTFSANRSLAVRSARLNAAAQIMALQEVRGGLSIDVPVTSSDDAVGVITDSPRTFPGGGGAQLLVTFDPLASGQTTLAVTQPAGYTTPANGATAITATVTAPDVVVGDAVVGRDLQQGLSVSLETAPPGPVDVTVSLADASVALVSKDRGGAGSGSVTFTGVTSSFVGTIWVQGLAEGATTIETKASGYDDDTSTVTVTPSGFYWGSGSFSSTTFSANRSLAVRSARLNASAQIMALQDVRGGLSVDVPVTSSDEAVGVITDSPRTFPGGGGSQLLVTFDPLASGQTTLAVTQPAGYTTPSNGATAITATVRPPEIVISDAAVGRDLQQGLSVSLETAPPSPVDVTITIASGSTAVVSQGRTTAGTTSVTFTDVTSTFVGNIWVQGLAEGTTSMLAQAPGYSDDTSNVTVTPSGFYWGSGSFSIDAGGANRSLAVRAARLNASAQIMALQEVRGGLSIDVPVTSSDEAVGVITDSPRTFPGGGGSQLLVTFDPLASGQTTLAVTQPAGYTAPSNGATAITATVTG